MTRRIRTSPSALASAFRSMKNDYAAATSSRFRRTRGNLGGTADVHITDERFRQVREYVRDMDRNDAIIGQLVDRAVDNTVRNGFELRPDTGDEDLDKQLKELWADWANDPQSCDIAGRFTFPQMERMVFRHSLVDGDCFALPTETGALQLMEGDWCVTAQTKKDVRLGVRVDKHGKPIEYWFAKSFPRDARIPKFGDIEPIEAFDAAGNPQVFHINRPKRITETRSMPAFTAVFDICGMIEDTNFAQVVKQQICSFFVVFVETDPQAVGSGGVPQFGAQTTATRADGTTETVEELEPGLFGNLPPGKKASAFSPNIPNPEFFTHMKMLLRIVAANLGLPYVLAMLDTTDTTFHGYRGELNQAQIGFECNQTNLEARFHRHVYRWKVRSWLEANVLTGTAVNKAVESGAIFRHKWAKPSWKSVDPKSDAEANYTRMKTLQASPSQIAAEQSLSHADIVRQTALDNAGAIRAAYEQAEKLQSEGIDAAWRDVLFLTSSMQAATFAPPGMLDKTDEERSREAEMAKEQQTGKTSGQRNRMQPHLNGTKH